MIHFIFSFAITVLIGCSELLAGVTVHPIGVASDSGKLKKQADFETVPIPRKVRTGVEWRESVFRESHIDQYIANFDEVEKDVLLLKLSHDSLEALKKRYPGIPMGVLTQGKQRVGSAP